MRRSLVKFSESEASNHTPSLADFTTTTPELKFSVHTGTRCWDSTASGLRDSRSRSFRCQTREAPPLRRRARHRPSQGRAPNGPQLSRPPQLRPQQRHPRRCRLQLPPPHQVAQDFVVPHPDGALPEVRTIARLKTYCSQTTDYQELKQEVGLGHYEGRGWRGFHHHATLCIAAYGFLIAERATIPPSGPRSSTPFQVPVLPDDYRPRGSALAAT